MGVEKRSGELVLPYHFVEGRVLPPDPFHKTGGGEVSRNIIYDEAGVKGRIFKAYVSRLEPWVPVQALEVLAGMQGNPQLAGGDGSNATTPNPIA